MPTPRLRRRGLQPTRRRALELLVSCPDGATDTLLMATHGLTTEMLVDLIRDGLATAIRRAQRIITSQCKKFRPSTTGWVKFGHAVCPLHDRSCTESGSQSAILRCRGSAISFGR